MNNGADSQVERTTQDDDALSIGSTLQFVVTDTSILDDGDFYPDNTSTTVVRSSSSVDLQVDFDRNSARSSSTSSALTTPRGDVNASDGDLSVSFRPEVDIAMLQNVIAELQDRDTTTHLSLPPPLMHSPKKPPPQQELPVVGPPATTATTATSTPPTTRPVVPRPAAAVKPLVHPTLFDSPRIGSQLKQTYYSPQATNVTTKRKMLREFNIVIIPPEPDKAPSPQIAFTSPRMMSSRAPIQRSVSSTHMIASPTSRPPQETHTEAVYVHPETTPQTAATILLSAEHYKLCSAFAVAQRVRLISEERCMACDQKIMSGFMAVQITLLHSPTTSAAENGLKIQILVRSMCRNCAVVYCDAIDDTLGTITRPLLKVNKPFAAQRLLSAIDTIALRFQLEIGKSVCTEGGPTSSATKCASHCSKSVDIQSSHTGLMIKHGASHEYSIAPCCSIACLAATRRVLAPENQKALPPVAQWSANSSGDVRYDMHWYSQTSVMSDLLYNDVCSGKLKLPVPTIIHSKCFSLACKVCELKRGGDITARSTVFVDSPQNAWLISVFKALFACNLHSDLLASNDQMECLVCKRPSSGICDSCRFVRVCKECASDSAYKSHEEKCKSHSMKSWSHIYFR